MTLEETIAFLQREQELADLRAVMDTVEGRRFIWKLLGGAGVFRSSFAPGQADTTAFNEGARNFGLVLLADLMEKASAQYLTMQREAMDNDQKRREERSRDQHGAQAGADPGIGDSHD